ncbi:MAG: hypothetical protein AB9834_20930 [Lentimicrobium sp.]
MSNETPGSIYNEMLFNHLELQQRLLRNSRVYAISRFIVFVIIIGSVIAAFTTSPLWWWPACMLLTAFIVLVVLNEKLIENQRFNDAVITATRQETGACQGQFSVFGGGGEYIDPGHIFTTDLDVFGDNSLFQAVNRSATHAGKAKLADWLKLPLTNKQKIEARQEAVKELATLPDWRIRLRAHGMVAAEDKSDIISLFEWISSLPMFKPIVFRIAVIFIPLLSFAFTALLISGVISMQLFLLYLILPLSVTGFYTKSINRRHMMLSKKVSILEKYSIRFRMIETRGFKSEFMITQAGRLKSGTTPASESIRKLGRITASLDTRLNLLAGFILNIFLLWDIRQMIRLEHWQHSHKDCLAGWFDVLSETEAVAGFGAFSFAFPEYVFPEIETEKYIIQASHAGHPLIHANQRVNNNILVSHKGHFNIVTGANMAGKSTYLRTVGVNMVLALAGAPVCASHFSCYPAPVFTSLRTTDSLSTNQSYFYAELLRLKDLIDRLGRGEELFILLDEILKGTNSADKQAGSKALLTQLIGHGAAGFIATHDLELGNLEKSFPDDVTNYSFEAEISGDELHFDYKLKPGIARNMNATFLMKKMGITL